MEPFNTIYQESGNMLNTLIHVFLNIMYYGPSRFKLEISSCRIYMVLMYAALSFCLFWKLHTVLPVLRLFIGHVDIFLPKI